MLLLALFVQATTIQVQVRSDGAPLAGAQVVADGVTRVTDAKGIASFEATPGKIEISVLKDGYVAVKSTLVAGPGRINPLVVDLELQPTHEEEVIVSATRTDKRVEDQPLRVEVVPGEEVQEKIMMTPGDVSMLLNETNGLRVQTTSPSLGGANVRIQGLRGRYTQILADGLPLYGGQTGSIGLLQIPPMDLGQVEVIKGVASALYGMSAIGGVVNLVTRRPPAQGREGEMLVEPDEPCRHRRRQLAGGAARASAGATRLSAAAHFQERSDLDRGRLDRSAAVSTRGRPAAAVLGRRRWAVAVRGARRNDRRAPRRHDAGGRGA